MTRRGRLAVFAPSVAGLAAVLAWGIGGLPAFGHYHGVYGLQLLAHGVRRSGATNLPSAVNFFFRAIDTVGEEFILFAAAVGCALILRELREDEERPPAEAGEAPALSEAGDALELLARPLVGAVAVLGLYIVIHGALTPGGGFQGGVILAGAILLAYLCGAYVAVRRLEPWTLLEATGAVGAAGLIAVGAAGAVAGRAFFANVLPLGTLGSLTSAGIIPVASVVVTLEVTSAVVIVAAELRDRSLLVRRRR